MASSDARDDADFDLVVLGGGGHVGLPLSLAFATVPLPTRIEARLLPAMNVAADASDEAAAERVRKVLESCLQSLGANRKTLLG